jgi:signal transduction histidine kinase
MNAMLARLETAHEKQRRFVADASHELRSPLTSIRAQVEVDLAQPAAAKPLVTASAVLAEALRIERLVDDLLLLAQSDEGGSQVTAPIDVDNVVFHEVERLHPMTAAVLDTSGVSGAQVLEDAGQLTRVVRNLLENATRFAGSRVEVALGESDGRVRLTVSDDASGFRSPIASESSSGLRGSTRRARDRTGRGAGSGDRPGHRRTARHGGAVMVDPDHATGARFVVDLPSTMP